MYQIFFSSRDFFLWVEKSVNCLYNRKIWIFLEFWASILRRELMYVRKSFCSIISIYIPIYKISICSQSWTKYFLVLIYIRNTAFVRGLHLQNLWESPGCITQCFLESCYGNESICLWDPNVISYFMVPAIKLVFMKTLCITFTVLDWI